MGYDAERAEEEWWSMSGAEQRRALQETAEFLRECAVLAPQVNFSGERKASVKPSTRKEQILARMRALEAEFAELEKLPDEPQGTHGPLIIHFIKKFHGVDTEYHYAFIKNPSSGNWSGTGPKAPKDYTWDDLVHWLSTTGPFPVIYKVDGLAEYYAPEEDE